jgi:protein FrlC
MTPGRGFENESRDDAWKRAVDGVGDVVDYAEAAGVRCGLEPLQRHESNLVNNSLQLAQMIDEIGSVNLYAALDTVAMATAGETVAGYVERFGSRIQHVHVIDGKPAGHLAWGDGNLPLDEYLRELGEADYAGYLSFEIFGTSNAAEPFDAHSRSLNAVRTALAA